MIEPARATFLLIDMQNGFIDGASPLCIAGAAATVPTCARALEAARAHGVPVYHVRRTYAADGSDVEAVRWKAWAEGGRPLSPADPISLDCPPELAPAPGEPVVVKPSWSAFFGTDLDALLRARGIGTIVLAGTTTPNCVRSTAYDGLALGFNVAVLRDATSSRSPEAQEANLADMEAAGIQLIHTDDFAANGLLHVRDTEAEVARAVALELEAKARNTETDAAADTAAANDSGAPLPPTPALESVETVSTGWINKYHLHYTLPDGRPYTYEGVSRKGPERYEAALEALGSTGAPDPDAVCIVPLLPDGSVLLEREFRYPLNSWCVSLPAGLIDAGESLEEAVARELSEETGYRLRDDIAPAVRPLPQPGFSSTGLTEENVQVVFAQVEAAGKARPDSAELIEPFTVARADLRAFLDANQLPIGTRCQLILELLAI
ncbi:MAG: isochorismatase family protein [Adlercreutzia equolifaciens]|uniref:isochorismatase family protein n=1 Tax=Adlercreutzia TaxID=447020 RepID=UPI001EDF07F4|nr:isochorismatase family protein [Adlercreutzia equolifaciens]MCG4824880.1 isochorismatase family protein [Adlercreutzia equolifaciens]MCQ5070388.1 isochorismatase family protein [Adlercreutzia sp. DFI.6.23]MEE0478201.1 isochorismatase family protein [Adlercreutzia sp.]